MPIPDNTLQSPKNRFIAVSGNATVGQAFGMLQALGGHSWWHLVVQMDDKSWGVTQFSNLVGLVESNPHALDARLGSLIGLVSASAADQESTKANSAEALVKRTGLLVVTRNGLPIGILVRDVTRGGANVPAAKLRELGGKYVNLKEYGALLLASSKKQGTQSSA